MLAVESHRILYADRRFHAAFPSVATLPDGGVLVAFRRARDCRWLHGDAGTAGADRGFDVVDHVDARSHTALLRCSPAGEPRGDVQALPPDPEAGDQDPSLLALRSGRIALGGFCWYPVPARHGPGLRARGIGLVGDPETTGTLFLFWGGYTRVSDDGGASWSPHRWLPELPDHGPIVPGARPMHGGAVRGRAVEAPDGALLMAAYAGRPYRSHLFASTDGGDTWALRGVIAEDRRDGSGEQGAGFCETALHRTEDGRLVALHRTTGLGDRLATSVSRDLGRTWEAWRTHGVIGHPYDACALPDGRVLVTYGHRHKPYGVRARIWDPGAGLELDAAPEIVIRDDAPSPDVGYPWAAVLADGRVMVVYYICDGAGVRHIAATFLSPER